MILPDPASAAPRPYEPITEHVICSGRFHTGERFTISRRTDGRFGFCVWRIADAASAWTVASSAATQEEARLAIESIVEEKRK